MAINWPPANTKISVLERPCAPTSVAWSADLPNRRRTLAVSATIIAASVRNWSICLLIFPKQPAEPIALAYLQHRRDNQSDCRNDQQSGRAIEGDSWH